MDFSGISPARLILFLYFLYMSHPKGKLYAAFIDLRGAFDSINRQILLEKLFQLEMEEHLLFLLHKFHSLNTCQIRYDEKGSLTQRIPMIKGVKQGCLLAPSLFNLFLSDLPIHLSRIHGHAPKLDSQPVPLLLYADDAVLLSFSKVGLKRLLSSFASYCNQNSLSINFEKSKILVFSKSWKCFHWKVEGKVIEQVKTFRYLGVLFHYKLSWSTHRKHSLALAKNQLSAVSRFHYQKGNQFVPAAIQVFQAKIITQLLYGIPIWILAFNKEVEQICVTFLRRILGIPNSVGFSTLYAELGLHLLESRAWITTIKYWLRLHFRSQSSSLMASLLTDSHCSKWSQSILYKINTLGIDINLLANSGETHILQTIKRRIWDIEKQIINARANQICSPSFLGLSFPAKSMAQYFANLLNPFHRRAFMLARMNIFPSAVLAGRYQNIPYEQRVCDCHLGEPESISHILLSCPLFSKQRSLLLGPFSQPNKSSAHGIKKLLADISPEVMEHIAEFLAIVLRERAQTRYRNECFVP